MSSVFEDVETDAILLVDASNAFNQMNRAAGLHNIRITCPKLSLYIINTYRKATRLFIAGGGEVLSEEGTTQGDPLAMPWYSINTTVIIDQLRSIPEVDTSVASWRLSCGREDHPTSQIVQATHH